MRAASAPTPDAAPPPAQVPAALEDSASSLTVAGAGGGAGTEADIEATSVCSRESLSNSLGREDAAGDGRGRDGFYMIAA